MGHIQDQIKGNWNQLKGKVKQEFAELTEDDLKFEEGKEEELLGRLQEKTGKAKGEIISFINNL